jgi:leucyl-tRNA synthetase
MRCGETPSNESTMTGYNPTEVEAKWQAAWARDDAFRVGEIDPARPTYFCLEMLPYPSGNLHMGHVRNYSIGDVVARYRAMCGEQVMHIIGWDAFGLPAENAAIRHKEDPGDWTRRNIETMRGQFRRLGLSYDWSREIATCDPEFYRWNQWFFLRMLERGIAYRAKRLLNWCANCATVLANEQVVGGRCWRCDGAVSRREFEQWFLRITDYAEELLDGLDRLEDWPERVRTMQRNWIGRSEGDQVRFNVEDSGVGLDVFTTRLDTIYGATYLALAPEHPELAGLVEGTPQQAEVTAFVEAQLEKSLEDRFAEGVEKLGVFSGRYAINPYSGERIPIWVANFVLMDVGTGAIMSVPAHDQRDYEFARAYGLPIRTVVLAEGAEHGDGEPDAAMPDPGRLTHSGTYDGLTSAEARIKMSADAEAAGFGGRKVTFRIKDWGVSRQRYWGTPIPVIHCVDCGIVGVPDEQLPVKLPPKAPLGRSGGSPLELIEEFVRVDCPKCGNRARRETDTMDTFVDSSWYYFRYLDPHNDAAPFAPDRVAPWMPVDLYIGGIEHATMHLIYTRFWTKVMRDLRLVELDEPVARLFTQGMVIKDGYKMAKSRGNVVDPDKMVSRYGADTTRLFSLFAAPPERDLEWSEAGVEGCARFLHRIWRVFERVSERLPAQGSEIPEVEGAALELRRKTHRTIQRVSEDIGTRLHLNTAVSAVMELINKIAPLADGSERRAAEYAALREAFETLAKLLSPFAPHFCEELWFRLGGEGFVFRSPWPAPDPAFLTEDNVTMVVQVNGKLRARVELPRDADEESALAAAREDSNVAAHLEGGTVRRVIHVPNKLLNLVVQ